MKLIYIATSVIPAKKANSYQVMKMGEAFAREGVDVELLIPVRFGGVREKGDAFEYYNIKNKFKIKKIFSIDLIPLEKIIGHLGFWIQNASFTILVSFYLLFRKVDIIYTRDKFTLFFLALLGKKNLVWEAHSFPKKFSWVYKFILKRLKKLVVISDGLRDEFMSNIEGEQTFARVQSYLEKNILVARDAVDLDEFDVKESQEECRKTVSLGFKTQTNVSMNKKIILYTGHLFKWKGVYTLADASKYLDDECEVVVVGGMDKDLENYKNYLRENGLTKVKALGFKNHKEIPYFLKAADVLVLPNSGCEKISSTYTSPMKLFEYMASGRPMVVSDLASLREILSEDEAIFVEPDKARDLAEGIERVLADESLSGRIALNARQKVGQYTWQKRASKILDFITRIKLI